jgi:hypothetical protein
MMVLQMGGVVKRDSRNLEEFQGAGGFSKLTELLRWVEASFPAAATGRVLPLWPAAPGWSEAAGTTSARWFPFQTWCGLGVHGFLER